MRNFNPLPTSPKYKWTRGAKIVDDFGPSEVHAMPLGVAGRTNWPLLTALFSLLSFCPGYFYYGNETLGMTYDGLGEIFEGDFTDMCAKISSGVDGVLSGVLRVRRNRPPYHFKVKS